MVMNRGKSRIERKPRKCALSEDVLAEIANILTVRFYEYAEVERLIRSYKCKCSVDSLLFYLEARNYLVASEKRKTYWGTRTAYRVMTKEIYIKIEEEHRKNAARRLLETVSC